MKSLGCLFVLLALTVGGLSLFVASANREAASGIALVAAFVLGVVGLVCIAAAKPDASTVEKRELRRGAAKICWYCAETIKAEATVCRYCGRELITPRLPPSISTESVQPPLTTETADPPLRPSSATEPHYLLWLQEEQSGPYTAKQVRAMLAQGNIEAETLVWEEGMPDWLSLPDTNVLGDKEQLISFACPRCTQKLEATGNQTGVGVTCPACQHHLKVPNSGSVETTVETEQSGSFAKSDLYLLAGIAAFILIIAVATLNSGHKSKSHNAANKQENAAASLEAPQQNNSTLTRNEEGTHGQPSNAASPSPTFNFDALEEDMLSIVESKVLSSSESRENEEAQSQLATLIKRSGGMDSLKQAASAGIVPALGLLGCLHHFGIGVPQDNEQASVYLKEASEKGDKLSMLILGMMYKLGTGVPQSDKQALNLFKQAGEKGDKLCMFFAANIYTIGGPDLTSDLPEALKWAAKAKAAGYPNADDLVNKLTRILSAQEAETAKSQAQAVEKAALQARAAKPEDSDGVSAVSSATIQTSEGVRERKTKYWTEKMSTAWNRGCRYFYSNRPITLQLPKGNITLRKGTLFYWLGFYAKDSASMDPMSTRDDRLDSNPAYRDNIKTNGYNVGLENEIRTGVYIPIEYFDIDETGNSAQSTNDRAKELCGPASR